MRCEPYAVQLSKFLHAELLLMLYTHLDESLGSRNLVLAGFIGGAQQWGFFESEWLGALKKYKIDPPFKMQRWQMRKTPFRNMPEQKRRDLLNELLAVIRSRAMMGVGAAVSLAAYEATFLDQTLRRRVGTPYCLCVTACIALVGKWARMYSHNEQVGYVIDRGHANAREALLAYQDLLKDKTATEKYRVGPLAFDDDLVAVPLQAADLVAYEAMRHLENRQLDQASMRYPFKQL